MKAVPRLAAHQQPSVTALEKSVLTLLGLFTLITFIWFLKGTARPTPSTYRPPVLNVALSGSFNSQLRLQELPPFELTKTGFIFTINNDLPFLVTFESREASDVYDLSDGVSTLTVTLLEHDNPYLTFTSLEGSLSYEGEELRFAARLEDERGYPLLLTGRLTLPQTASAQTSAK